MLRMTTKGVVYTANQSPVVLQEYLIQIKNAILTLDQDTINNKTNYHKRPFHSRSTIALHFCIILYKSSMHFFALTFFSM